MNVYRYETIDSTNTECRRLIMQNAVKLPAVVLAKAQSAGRGRQGRSFYSPANTGLYMSVAHIYPENETDAAMLTVRTSLAVAQAIEKVTGIAVGIKWVNDLYVDERKVCGILTESFFCMGIRYVIIGVGINVLTKEFPAELSGKAGALNVPADCIDSLWNKIAENITDIFSGGSCDMEEYRRRSVVIGQKVSFEEQKTMYTGCAVGITETGALEVRLENGEVKYLHSGEVRLASWQ